jgi:hypothetical protein
MIIKELNTIHKNSKQLMFKNIHIIDDLFTNCQNNSIEILSVYSFELQ